MFVDCIDSSRYRVAEEFVSLGWNIPRGLHGHAMTTAGGIFLSADDAFCEIVGRDLLHLQRLNILDVTHKMDRSSNHDALEQLRAAGRPFEITKRYVDSEGKPVLVHNRVSRFRDGLGPDRIVAAVEVLGPVATYPTEHDLLSFAEMLRDEHALRPARYGERKWSDVSWGLLLAVFVLEQRGQPVFLKDVCAAAGQSNSEGNLFLLELLGEGWIDLDRAAATLEESSAIMTIKGRTIVTEHLTRLMQAGLADIPEC